MSGRYYAECAERNALMIMFPVEISVDFGTRVANNGMDNRNMDFWTESILQVTVMWTPPFTVLLESTHNIF